ncbi:MutM-like protein-1 [Mycena kentingensis (nom. inval.)]|nr:MutM-like protein-1 [Mycena kentingensis (nom. inval.)]
MPELPEVQRAVNLLNKWQGSIIVRVDALQDDIVFAETNHNEFVRKPRRLLLSFLTCTKAKELAGRTIQRCERYGKMFWLELSGPGRQPLLHFGMTGMLQVKGQLPAYYKDTPKSASADWPPRFMKFILHLSDGASVAFLDPRRLGRIRLVQSPGSRAEPPLSDLGFDPLLSMPSIEVFKDRTLARACPIKALLLDQKHSAGVGNWVADEILYHARVHPEQRSNTLTDAQLAALYYHTSNVCRVAVAVDADDTRFPDDWLFRHRWGKRKKAASASAATLKLPTGEPATIKWITVGGRTSAYVAELQHLDGPVEKVGRAKRKAKVARADVQTLSPERVSTGRRPTGRSGRNEKYCCEEAKNRRCIKRQTGTSRS